MTIRDLLDQVEIQGPVSVLENVEDVNKILYEGYGCYLSKKAKVYLDREITYIYPSYQDLGAGVVIEIKQQFCLEGKLKVMMTIDQIVNNLEKLSNGTDFSFEISENKNEEIELLVDGDNPQCEDWCFYITIETPDTEEDLAKSLSKEFWNLYNDYNVEENVYMWLGAKRNGTSGVPGVVDLVHNEEYKEKALRNFAEKMDFMC